MVSNIGHTLLMVKNPKPKLYGYNKKEDLFYAESRFVAARVTKADFLSYGMVLRYFMAFIYVPFYFIASCIFFISSFLFLTIPFGPRSENTSVSLMIFVSILCILGAVAAALTGIYYLKQVITASKWFRKNLHAPRKPLTKKQKVDARHRRVAMGVIGIIVGILALFIQFAR